MQRSGTGAKEHDVNGELRHEEDGEPLGAAQLGPLEHLKRREHLRRDRELCKPRLLKSRRRQEKALEHQHSKAIRRACMRAVSHETCADDSLPRR